MPKTVSPSKIQEWKGLDNIQRIVHEMSCIYRELQKDDYGIDGEIEIVEPLQSGQGFKATGGILKFQSKSGDSYIKQDKKESFTTYVSKDDLEYWHKLNFPILYIVYHPTDNKLYYKDIKEYIRLTPDVFSSPTKIEFNKENDLFDKNAYTKLSEISGNRSSRISYEVREKLYTNLLPVRKLPNLITYAPTTFINREEVFAEANKSFPKNYELSAFTIKGNKLYTIGDLRDTTNKLRKFCDTKDINDASAKEWITDEDKKRDLIYLYNQFIGKHLRIECGLEYSPKYKRSYFPRTDKKSKEFLKGWHNVRTGKDVVPRIVVKYYEYGKDKFWRHSAFTYNLRNIGTSWFLEISPMYFFTEDGENPCSGLVAGPYTTKIKAQERNLKVLNDVLFWADVMSNGKHQIEMSMLGVKLIVEKTPYSDIANFSIPSDPAIFEEEEEYSNFFQIWEEDNNTNDSEIIFYD